MAIFSARRNYFIGIFICLSLLSAAYYFQYIQGMEPCLLCILQRTALWFIAFVLLIMWWRNPAGNRARAYLFFVALGAAGGLAAAARQTWLQHQPKPLEDVCVPGLRYLLQTQPIPQVIKIMLHTETSCARVVWRFIGLSMAEWMVIMFVGFMLFAIVQSIRITNN